MFSLVRKACLDERSTSTEFKESTSEQYNNMYVRQNKIKVLVFRQRGPLKISADGTFLLPYRIKIAAAPYF
jgi:hypothetical protein